MSETYSHTPAREPARDAPPSIFRTHPTPFAMNPNDLRERHQAKSSHLQARRVQIQAPVVGPRQRLQQQRERILKFQQRWERIKTDLPPQLSRKHSTEVIYRI